MHSFKRYFPFIFFVFIVGGLWIRSITLSSVPFFDWDESIYAKVAREWLRHPGLTLHYNGGIWFEKPPLLFAVIGSLFQVFGVSEFIARLPSVIAAICCVVLVFQSIKRITKNMLAQIAGVLMFAATPFFIDRASIVNVDIFLTLGWLLYVCDNTFVSKLIGTIIGTWTKSFLGLIPLCVDFALSIYYRSLSKKKIREWAVIISTSLIWHVVMTVQYSDLFISSHIKDHLISRATTPIELHFGGKFFYLEKVWANYPWLAIIACIGVIAWIITLVKHRDTNQIDIFFLLPLVYLALLTVSKSKLSWYIVPALPFVAMWIVYSISHIPRKSLQTLCYFVLIGWSGYMFLRQTIGFTVQGNVIPEQVALARCQKGMPPFTRVAYLVAPTQRKDAQVIEAAQVSIASSFIYGSAPTFVFYLDKPVTFFYKPELFLSQVSKYDAYAMHVDDLALLSRSAQDAFASSSAVITECQRGNWVLYAHSNTSQSQ
jgi:4-amino-4-deoxy-L-arabinose transferase-like glycosyltransferase